MPVARRAAILPTRMRLSVFSQPIAICVLDRVSSRCQQLHELVAPCIRRVMPVLIFTIAPAGVGQLSDLLTCLAKFDENVALEATPQGVGRSEMLST